MWRACGEQAANKRRTGGKPAADRRRTGGEHAARRGEHAEPCSEPAAYLRRTCGVPGAIMRRTWSDHAANMQRTCAPDNVPPSRAVGPVLVEVESLCPAEAHPRAHQRGVEPLGSGAGGHPQHGVGMPAQVFGHQLRRLLGKVCVGWHHSDLHGDPPSARRRHARDRDGSSMYVPKFLLWLSGGSAVWRLGLVVKLPGRPVLFWDREVHRQMSAPGAGGPEPQPEAPPIGCAGAGGRCRRPTGRSPGRILRALSAASRVSNCRASPSRGDPTCKQRSSGSPNSEASWPPGNRSHMIPSTGHIWDKANVRAV